MTTHEYYLNEIRKNPEEDEPRLAYADWLETLGEEVWTARAEFIRLQCEFHNDKILSHLWFPYENTFFWYNDARELRRRELELGGRFYKLWDMPLEREFVQRKISFLYHRGMIGWLDISDEEFFELGPTFTNTPELAGLTRLSLCAMRDIPPLDIFESPDISPFLHLDLRMSLMTDTAIHCLVNSSSTKEFHSLWLGLGRYASPDREEVRKVGFLLTSDAIKDVSESSKSTPLKQLDLSVSAIGDEGITHLTRSKHIKRLEMLLLGESEISTRGISVLCDSPLCRTLETLELGGNNLNDEAARCIAESSHLKNLLFLTLFNPGIGDEGLIALTNSENFSQLVELDLGGNRLGEKALRALAESKNFPNLQSLQMRYCDVTDSFLYDLAKSQMLSNLRGLDISDTQITDEGIIALAKSGKLERLTDLHIGGNNISERARKMINDALPQ